MASQISELVKYFSGNHIDQNTQNYLEFFLLFLVNLLPSF